MNVYDDGGSFHRILREAEALAVDALLILSEEVVTLTENRVAKFDNLGFHVPRRRSAVTEKLPGIPADMPTLSPLVLNKKKKIILKRCFDQTQNRGKEEKHRIEEENGTDVVLVIQKHITASDLKKKLNRLSIPKDQIRADDFVNEEEKKNLEDKNPIRVLLIPPSLKENVTLDLKRWTMNNTFSYNLIDKWYSSVVEDADNRLEIGSLVQLWRFRKNITDLCFALVKVE
ncbi:B3 domain-containing protein [Melia azedarach]|uniref:B3 domain-containing protein n=1 Tax=Melia azedarach TaxID=155640 RepID=A0ACC1Y187_MELAZ|nr:B3 domain-containing protein [Melia azedarach]